MRLKSAFKINCPKMAASKEENKHPIHKVRLRSKEGLGLRVSPFPETPDITRVEEGSFSYAALPLHCKPVVSATQTYDFPIIKTTLNQA